MFFPCLFSSPVAGLLFLPDFLFSSWLWHLPPTTTKEKHGSSHCYTWHGVTYASHLPGLGSPILAQRQQTKHKFLHHGRRLIPCFHSSSIACSQLLLAAALLHSSLALCSNHATFLYLVLWPFCLPIYSFCCFLLPGLPSQFCLGGSCNNSHGTFKPSSMLFLL